MSIQSFVTFFILNHISFVKHHMYADDTQLDGSFPTKKILANIDLFKRNQFVFIGLKLPNLRLFFWN